MTYTVLRVCELLTHYVYKQKLERLRKQRIAPLKQCFKGVTFLVLSCLNKLDTATKGTKRFSNPDALSIARDATASGL